MAVSARARAVWAVFACALMACGVAWAHGFTPAYLELREEGDGRVEMRWKVPYGGDGVTREDVPVAPHFTPACRVIGGAAPLVTPLVSMSRTWLDCSPRGLSGRTVTLTGLRERGADALVRVRYASGREFSAALSPESPSVDLPSASALPRGRVARSYLRLGVTHILTGIDHLAFVLGLMLLVRGVRELIRTVTAFTLGHSVTLALAALGGPRVASAPVEACIALSVTLLAVEASRRFDRGEASASWTGRRPWWIAGAFGLLHGFGFAGALTEVGLPEGQMAWALGFFNAGVELGQVVFVVSVLALWSFARRLRWPVWAWRVPVYAIGGMSVYWLCDRVAAL